MTTKGKKHLNERTSTRKHRTTKTNDWQNGAEHAAQTRTCASTNGGGRKGVPRAIWEVDVDENTQKQCSPHQGAEFIWFVDVTGAMLKSTNMKRKHTTDKTIGCEGARELGESLKTNTTLTSLSLKSEQAHVQ